MELLVALSHGRQRRERGVAPAVAARRRGRRGGRRRGRGERRRRPGTVLGCQIRGEGDGSAANSPSAASSARACRPPPQARRALTVRHLNAARLTPLHPPGGQIRPQRRRIYRLRGSPLPPSTGEREREGESGGRESGDGDSVRSRVRACEKDSERGEGEEKGRIGKR
ncbi:hypothetical protein [Oryza sativa Japonica Group]|uniref:Uncharacterized protein n=2 Tax=Oryza sativa subsp. japonica TaxID=39947 RepID=Q5JN95_ORYSJ|nr:hypothetical protein [Oryza sativa Japonica Group]BAD87443.1 hypothetical protein [Oryza sativa Japonica Group]